MNASSPETCELQRAFAAAVLDASRSEAILPALSGELDRMRERLAIYRGNMRANWGKALRGAYPIVAQLVGREFFDGLAREYGRAHPSKSGDLNEFGGEFADFVATFPHTQSLPYLPDVARMEWLLHGAHYATDVPPLELARLAAVSEKDYGLLHFVLAPAAALLTSRWPLARIWTVHQPAYAGEPEVDLDEGPDWLLIHRPQFEAMVSAITASEFAFLFACVNGEALSQALTAAIAAEDSFDLGAALAHWAGQGVICDFRVANKQESTP